MMPIETLPFRVQVAANAGYDDNSNTVSGGGNHGSFFSDLSVAVSYAFGTLRTRGSISTSASVTYFDNGDGPVEFRPDLHLQGSLHHDVSERLSLSLGESLSYGVEPDFSLGIAQNRRTGNFFYSGTSLSASYLWLERFSTVTSYSVDIIRYDDQFLSLLQDQTNQVFGEQFRFLFLPVTTIVGEYRFRLTSQELPNSDATAHFFLAGVDHTLGPHVQMTFRAGAEFRNSDREAGTGVSPYFDGSLNCNVGEKTSLNWNVHYSTDESGIVGVGSRKSFRTGLTGSYGLTARISSNVSAYYVHDENSGDTTVFNQGSFSEDSVDFALNIAYALSERFSANAGYHRTEVLSDSSQRSYSRSRYSGGVSYSF